MRLSNIWNWITLRKNFMVISALISALGYFYFHKSSESKYGQMEQNFVFSPSIKIDNARPQTVTSDIASNTNVSGAAVELPKIKFPIRRNVGLNIPVEFLPGFTLTVISIYGSPEEMKVEVENKFWQYPHVFEIGAPPVDITFEGRLYRLRAEKVNRQTITMRLDKAF